MAALCIIAPVAAVTIFNFFTLSSMGGLATSTEAKYHTPRAKQSKQNNHHQAFEFMNGLRTEHGKSAKPCYPHHIIPKNPKASLPLPQHFPKKPKHVDKQNSFVNAHEGQTTSSVNVHPRQPVVMRCLFPPTSQQRKTIAKSYCHPHRFLCHSVARSLYRNAAQSKHAYIAWGRLGGYHRTKVGRQGKKRHRTRLSSYISS